MEILAPKDKLHAPHSAPTLEIEVMPEKCAILSLDFYRSAHRGRYFLSLPQEYREGWDFFCKYRETRSWKMCLCLPQLPNFALVPSPMSLPLIFGSCFSIFLWVRCKSQCGRAPPLRQIWVGYWFYRDQALEKEVKFACGCKSRGGKARPILT